MKVSLCKPEDLSLIPKFHGRGETPERYPPTGHGTRASALTIIGGGGEEEIQELEQLEESPAGPYPFLAGSAEVSSLGWRFSGVTVG